MSLFRLILLVLLSAQVVLAQEPGQEQSTAPEPRELPAEVAAEFDARLAEIKAQKKIVDQLAKRAKISEGLIAEVLGARMDAVWAQMFTDTVALAYDISAERDDGFEVSAIADDLTEDMQAFPQQAVATMDRLRDNIVFPAADLEPHEFVVADQQLLQLTLKLDSVLGSLITYLAIADSLGVDMAVEREYLVDALEDSAANRSVFLQLALEDVTVLRAAVAALPGGMPHWSHEQPPLRPAFKSPRNRYRASSD